MRLTHNYDNLLNLVRNENAVLKVACCDPMTEVRFVFEKHVAPHPKCPDHLRRQYQRAKDRKMLSMRQKPKPTTKSDDDVGSRSDAEEDDGLFGEAPKETAIVQELNNTGDATTDWQATQYDWDLGNGRSDVVNRLSKILLEMAEKDDEHMFEIHDCSLVSSIDVEQQRFLLTVYLLHLQRELDENNEHGPAHAELEADDDASLPGHARSTIHRGGR